MLTLKKHKGFTLIEILISLGVMSIFSSVIIASINYIIKSNEKYSLTKNGTYILESVSKEFKYNIEPEEVNLIIADKLYLSAKDIIENNHINKSILDLILLYKPEDDNYAEINFLENKSLQITVNLKGRLSYFKDFLEIS